MWYLFRSACQAPLCRAGMDGIAIPDAATATRELAQLATLRGAASTLRTLTPIDPTAIPRARAVVAAETLDMFHTVAAKQELQQAMTLIEAGDFAGAAGLIEHACDDRISQLATAVQELRAHPPNPYRNVPQAELLQKFKELDSGWTTDEEYAQMREMAAAADPATRAQMIEQLMSGYTSGDAEACLHFILQDARGPTQIEGYREQLQGDLDGLKTSLTADQQTRLQAALDTGDPTTLQRALTGIKGERPDLAGDIDAILNKPLPRTSLAAMAPSDDFRKTMSRLDQDWLYDELGGDQLADAQRWTAQASPPQQMVSGIRHINQFDERIDGTRVRNSCGTSSTAMVMQRFLGECPATQVHNIDRAIRPAGPDIFSTPTQIVDYMESNGMRAGMQTEGTPEQLKNFVDKGIPVTCLIDGSEGSGRFSPHYVVVTGYKTDDTGKITHIVLDNPGRSPPQEVPVEEFMQWWSAPGSQPAEVMGEHWDRHSGPKALLAPGMAVASAGLNLYDRAMIVGVPRQGTITQPDGQTIAAADVNLPGRARVSLGAQVANVVGPVITGTVQLAVDAWDGVKRIGNLFTDDSSDQAAADINGKSDTDVRNMPSFGANGKFWHLEQALWGITGDQKEQAILKLLRNSNPYELMAIQLNLPGGFQEIYNQVADGGDHARGAEILTILAQALQSPVKNQEILVKAMQEVLKEASPEARALFLESLATSGTPVPAGMLQDAGRGLDTSKYDFVPNGNGSFAVRLKPVPVAAPG